MKKIIREFYKGRKKKTVKELLIRFFDRRFTSGQVIEGVLFSLNILICVLFVVETYVGSSDYKQFFLIFELITITIFTLDYVIRFYIAQKKLAYVFDKYSIIDIIAIVPTILLFTYSTNLLFLKAFRILKVFKIFSYIHLSSKNNTFFGKNIEHLVKVIQLVFIILVIFFVSSGLFYHVERDVNEKITTFGDAFYYTVVTLTTVGYGDITPASSAGRMVTVIMILSGVILIPWQASQIVKEWIILSHKKDILCSSCGAQYHDRDAIHCKMCGEHLFQLYDG